MGSMSKNYQRRISDDEDQGGFLMKNYDQPTRSY